MLGGGGQSPQAALHAAESHSQQAGELRHPVVDGHLGGVEAAEGR
jgi:hypothetical protein